jgi:hypothetical protein
MTNDYFDTYTALPRNQLARAEAVNAIIDSIVGGFDKLPSASLILETRASFQTDTGTADTYILTPATPITEYNPGAEWTFKAVHSNDGPCTLNVSGLGVVAIKHLDGTDLQTGDIVAGQIVEVRHDGTYFQLITTPGSFLSAAATEAAAEAIAAATAAATTATNAATAASGSQTSASSSASSASGSASSAAGSATAAAASASAASGSASAASTSATSAAASAASINPSTYMSRANNLGDVANASSARGNLGLRIGTMAIFIQGSDPGGSATTGDLWGF